MKGYACIYTSAHVVPFCLARSLPEVLGIIIAGRQTNRKILKESKAKRVSVMFVTLSAAR